MKLIASEQQAERIGEAVTGGKRDKLFTVFQYVHAGSRLTLFGFEITDSGKRIIST